MVQSRAEEGVERIVGPDAEKGRRLSHGVARAGTSSPAHSPAGMEKLGADAGLPTVQKCGRASAGRDGADRKMVPYRSRHSSEPEPRGCMLASSRLREAPHPLRREGEPFGINPAQPWLTPGSALRVLQIR